MKKDASILYSFIIDTKKLLMLQMMNFYLKEEILSYNTGLKNKDLSKLG